MILKNSFFTKELITPSHSPYSKPAFLVREMNGKRLIVDYRKLHEQTIKSCWPKPSIEKSFDTPQGSAYFTTIEMLWRFHQLLMEPLAKTIQYSVHLSDPSKGYACEWDWRAVRTHFNVQWNTCLLESCGTLLYLI